MRSPPPKLWLCLSAVMGSAVASTGCPKKTDPTPQIKVSEGAANRINLIPSKSNRKQANATSKARVHPLARGAELGGPNATGKAGD